MTRDNIVGTLHGDDHVQGALSVGGGVSSYNELEDLPTLNGEIIEGDHTSEYYGIFNTTPFINPSNEIYSQPNVSSGTYTYTATEDCCVNAVLSNSGYYAIDGVTVFYFDGSQLTAQMLLFLKKGQTLTMVAVRNYNSFKVYSLY